MLGLTQCSLALGIASLLVGSSLALADAWPALPPADGTVMIPAQESPYVPGPRQVKVYLTYPGGTLDGVKASTGLMLSLHNWCGTGHRGTADPKFLTRQYDVVTIGVDYLQSGQYDKSIPYDFGYLQALDALRALWFVSDALDKLGRPFARGRLFSTGGSGGGNVTLMANKLAPRTFACIVDCSGMARLTDDIAFGLEGGSQLNAGYKQDPSDPHHLTKDAQLLRFVGHPPHLATMKALGNTCKIVVSHGTRDHACPYRDAREMVENMQAAGLDVEAHFIRDQDRDGKVIKDTGHGVGDRTLIVDKFAGKFLRPDSPTAKVRVGKCDFERRDEKVRYATPNGSYVISYKDGYPVGRFEPKSK
ncbi:MAG: DUF2920 family protein [Phycisphaerae bacterium]|nr:DUF2920 family protein [Phycisphaerae bacterium]